MPASENMYLSCPTELESWFKIPSLSVFLDVTMNMRMPHGSIRFSLEHKCWPEVPHTKLACVSALAKGRARAPRWIATKGSAELSKNNPKSIAKAGVGRALASL